MQTLRDKEVKYQGNWNDFFLNANKQQLASNQQNQRQNNFSSQNQNQIQEVSKSQNWNGEYSYVEINQISIPMQAIQEVQQEVDNHINISSLKQQFLDKMHQDFVNKNFQIFKKINSPLNNKNIDNNQLEKNIQNKAVDSNPSLKILIENNNKLFQQNPYLQTQDDDDVKSDFSARESLIQRYEVINKNFSAQKADEFKQFVNNIFGKNSKQIIQLYVDIKEEYMKKIEMKKAPNKNKYIQNLFRFEDYMYDRKLIEEILNSIYRFGVDRCEIQKNYNQIIMSETLEITFQERKTLKTIIYSILHHNLCKQDQKLAKQYIYRNLAHIRKESYILRQIFLHFLQIIIINSDHSKQTTEFLDNIFKFEFLSSLLCDYLLLSAKIILKIKNKKYQNLDLYALIDQLSKANNFNLYLLSQKQAECKKYLYAKLELREIFIYFEQSLQQDQNLPVYYVINPNDQLICLANRAF